MKSLEETVLKMQTKLEVLKKVRNAAQVECDKVQSYDSIVKCDIEEAEMLQDIKDQEIEQVEEDNTTESRVYEHKIRHLKYEHEKKITEIKEGCSSLRNEFRNEHESDAKDMLQETERLKDDIREMNVVNHNGFAILRNKRNNEN